MWVCGTAKDNAGNAGFSSPIEFKVDKSASSVEAGSDKTTNTQFLQDATVSDELSGILSYLWEKISGVGAILFGTLTAEDTTVQADTDGTYDIRLTVIDNAGNLAFDIFTLRWGTVAPTFTINNGTDPGPVQSDTIKVTISESILSGEYGFSSDSTCDALDTYGNAFSSGTDFSVADNRTDYLCVKATDIAENTGYGFVGQLNTDNTPPIVTAVDSDGQTYSTNTTSPQTITVTFNEDIANTPTVEVHTAVPVDPQVVTDCGDADAETFCFAYSIPALQEMTHTIYIFGAQDIAGNTMIADSGHTFRVDTLAPTIIFTDDVETGPVMSDNIAINFGGSTVMKYGYVGSAGDCVSSMETSGFSDYSVNFAISNESFNNQYVCAYGEDAVGNKAALASANDLNIDITAPQ